MCSVFYFQYKNIKFWPGFLFFYSSLSWIFSSNQILTFLFYLIIHPRFFQPYIIVLTFYFKFDNSLPPTHKTQMVVPQNAFWIYLLKWFLRSIDVSKNYQVKIYDNALLLFLKITFVIQNNINILSCLHKKNYKYWSTSY